jgi:DNA-binding NtrC family response regulator
MPLLIQDFLGRYNRDYGKEILGLSPDTMSMLDAYDWPGNVRELKNVIHRAVVVCTGKVITPQHLSKRIKPGDGSKAKDHFNRRDLLRGGRAQTARKDLTMHRKLSPACRRHPGGQPRHPV